MNHNVIYYLALALCVSSIVLFYFFSNFAEKNKNVLDLQGFLKKYGVLSVISGVTFLVGFILFNVAFFNDEATTKYLAIESISVKPVSNFLTYGMGSLFVIALFSFIYNIYIYYGCEDYKFEKHKLFKYIYLISIPLMIGFLWAYTEGIAPYLQYPLANAIHIGKEGLILVRNSNVEGGLNIALYAVFILAGASLVLFVVNRIAYTRYGDKGMLTTVFLIALPAGILGARIWYVVLDISANGANSEYIQNPGEFFRFDHGGLAVMGGAVLGIIVGVAAFLLIRKYTKKESYKKTKFWDLIDFIIPCILFAQAIGRIGNFFNNEVNGYAVSMDNFKILPSIIKNQMQYAAHGSTNLVGTNEMYLPLFLIEALTNTCGYFFIYFGLCKGYILKGFIKCWNAIFKNNEKLIIKRESFHIPGSGLGLYLIWYGLTRVLLEPLRTPEDYYVSSIYSGIGMASAGLLIIIALIFINKYLNKKEQEKLALETSEGEVTEQEASEEK